MRFFHPRLHRLIPPSCLSPNMPAGPLLGDSAVTGGYFGRDKLGSCFCSLPMSHVRPSTTLKQKKNMVTNFINKFLAFT